MIEALLFDVFGTVVDWRTGVAREVEAFFADSEHEVDSVAFADSWRAKYQPSMEEIRSGRRGYTVLDMLHRENLDATLAEFGLDDAVDDEGRARLNRAWEALPPWPDAVPGLNALHGRYLLAPCSNGSIAMMARLARSAGLPWDAIVGADIGRGYKPQAAVYIASAAALGLAPAQVMMVAAHNFDLAAAREAGLATAFVARPDEYGDGPVGKPDLAPSDDWEAVVPDFMALARQMGVGT
ncbi:MAG: haloacid dehalogenase type II [Rhodospirillales bacterium]|nr:haloacid dehalogenase type II [Rhodospirillales bacterium]MDE0379031.1 haloacid dehalogenase type II [Rhodospirillales bacterium]